MKKFVKFLIFVILVAAIIIGVRTYQNYKIKKAYPISDIDMSYDDYKEKLKEEVSEIKGMTKYDKLEMGLSPFEDDSDHDGLTDEDELFKYDSDPAKMSTSGDFYSDKYKVDNNMDIHTKYDYDGTLEFRNNKSKDIILTPVTLEDIYATVEEIATPKDLEYTVYKRYRLYNFTGSVSIDLTDIIDNNDVSIDNIDLYIYRLGEATSKVKFATTGNVAALNYKFKMGDMYYIYAVNKQESKDKDVIGDFNSLVSATVDSIVNEYHMETRCLAVVKPVISFVSSHMGSQSGVKVYYVDTNDTYGKNTILSKMSDAINLMGAINNNMDTYYTVDCPDYIPVTEERYNFLLRKYEALDAASLMADHKYNGSTEDQSLSQYLTWCYFEYNDIKDYEYYNNEENVIPVEEWEKKGFDMEKETLPFGNFATELSPNGTCMGICALTAKLHNTGSVPASGSYYMDDVIGKINWDLTTDSDNATLMDRGLNDYKTEDFTKSGSKSFIPSIDPQTDGERQFVNMVCSYWKNGNDKSKLNSSYRNHKYNNARSGYEYTNITEVMKKIDKGDVVICGLGTKQNAHAIILYDYVKNDDDSVDFLVYDCNYKASGSVGLSLKIVPLDGFYEDGYHMESFAFVYKTPYYTITSINEDFCMIMFDENFNVIGEWWENI